MRTKAGINRRRKGARKIITTLIGKRWMLVVAISLAAITAQSQNIKIKSPRCLGLAAMAQTNANGYGGAFVPALFYKESRNTFLLGPVLQFRKMNFSGMQFTYQYALTGEDVSGYQGEPELYLFGTGAYYGNALLGYKTLQNEYTANANAAEQRVDMLSFRSAEVFGGAGLKLCFLHNFKWLVSAGLGVSSCLGVPQNGLYHQPCNFGLSIRTGLTYDLR